MIKTDHERPGVPDIPLAEGAKQAGDPVENRLLAKVDALRDLGEGWDGYDVAAPDPDAIKQAKVWLLKLYREMCKHGGKWSVPNVTANEEGDVVFEWMRGEKALAIYITSNPDETWYLQSWGPSVLTEMVDGPFHTIEDYLRLWSWFWE